MDILSESGMEILGRERRARWTRAEKLEIVAAVGVNDEPLSRVAQRFDSSIQGSTLMCLIRAVEGA